MMINDGKRACEFISDLPVKSSDYDRALVNHIEICKNKLETRGSPHVLYICQSEF